MPTRRNPAIPLVALATLGSGLINLYSVIEPSLPGRTRWLRGAFPLDFLHLSRFLTLLTGFALVIASLHLYRRKRRAWQLVAALSAASVVFHLTKGLDYEEAVFSLGLIGLLLATRRNFTVRSSAPSGRRALAGLAVAATVALGYGIAGFWFLEPREFGIDFTLADAALRAVRFLTFAGDPAIVPRTRHAAWFLDSLEIMTVAVMVYGVVAVFRPVLHVYRTAPQERERAREIVRKHGRSSLDFFKCWPDKSLFFSETGESFLAYGVVRGFAIVLGDPVGEDGEIEGTVRAFADLCGGNDWRHAFYQALPDFLPLYRCLGYRKLKIGDDAIVDLAAFTLEGKAGKKLRSRVRQLEETGITAGFFDPPIPEAVLTQAREVSDEWLQIPGRRERGFTLGQFDPEYIRATPLFAVRDGQGRFLAFANQIPSPCPGEATIDLMRHRLQAPNGTMDFLLVKLFQACRERGFRRFNLGMAPMAGFGEHEQATREERAIHYFMQQMEFLFSYSGLYYYKAKFASRWEPRYAIYQNPLDLPRLALALRAVSERPA